jgi:hypothetical protein
MGIVGSIIYVLIQAVGMRLQGGAQRREAEPSQPLGGAGTTAFPMMNPLHASFCLA